MAADLAAISRNQYKFGAWICLIICLCLYEFETSVFCGVSYRWSTIAVHGYFIILTAFVVGDILGDSGERGFTELILFVIGAILQLYVGIQSLLNNCHSSSSSYRLKQIIYSIALIISGALLIIELVQKRRN